ALGLTATSPLTNSSRTPTGSSPNSRNWAAVIFVVLMMDMVRLGGQYSKWSRPGGHFCIAGLPVADWQAMVSKMCVMFRCRFWLLGFVSLGIAALAYGGPATRPAPEEILRARIAQKGPLL